MLRIKRIYDKPHKNDGLRVLVDRLWPRGVSKTQASIDVWLKEVAPSPGLRIWFGHEPERFAEFSTQYRSELENNPAVERIEQLESDNKTVTLLYAAKDPTINHAVVLQGFLKKSD